MKHNTVFIFAAFIVLIASVCHAEVKTVIGHNAGPSATADFKLEKAPQPSRNEAATQATFTVVADQQELAPVVRTW